MTNDELLKQIAPPFGDLYVRKETFEEYKNRISPLVPNFPDNVMEQWLYRHFEFIDYDYLNLGLERMEFSKEAWESDRIYHDINPFIGDSFDSMGHHVYATKTWLTNFMITKRTWPQPIIVLKNENLDGWGKPYHLLEGHQRLDYFREIFRKEKNTLLKTHELWIVSLTNK